MNDSIIYPLRKGEFARDARHERMTSGPSHGLLLQVLNHQRVCCIGSGVWIRFEIPLDFLQAFWMAYNRDLVSQFQAGITMREEQLPMPAN
jgi:hypothetical protein